MRILIAVLVVTVGATLLALQYPQIAQACLLVFVAVVVGAGLRRVLGDRSRLILLGTILGSGGFLGSLFGSLSAFIVLGALVAATPPLGRARSRLAFHVSAWLMLFGGIALTGTSALVPVARWVGFLCLAVASVWVFGRTNRTAGPALVLSSAGVTGAIGVYISAIVGRPLFQSADIEARFVGTLNGGLRFSGFGSAPNEVALLLSAAVLAVAFTIILRPSPPTYGAGSAFVVLLVISPALIMTGSRSALLGVVSAVLILLLSQAFRRPWLAAAGVTVVVAATFAVQSLAVFQNRSLNIFASQDGSSLYRRSVQDALWSRIDGSLIRGVGFLEGNLIAPNAYTSGVNNIDNAWLYVIYPLGILTAAGMLTLVIFTVLKAARANIFLTIASALWVAVITSAENVWVLNSVATAVMLALSSTYYAARMSDEVSGSPHLKHALVRDGTDESTSVGVRSRRT